MIRYFVLASLMLAGVTAKGQIEQKAKLTEQEAKNLLKSLDTDMQDTTRMVIYLKLADYNLQKEEGEITALRDAGSFILKAKEINSRQSSRKRDGVISLFESILEIQKGDTESAKRLANIAIDQLKRANDEFHLALAYCQLSRCYDSNNSEQATTIRNVYKALFQRVPKLVRPTQVDTCLFEIRDFYFRTGGVTDSLKLDFLDHLLRSYKMLNDKKDEFWTRKEIADIHYRQGNTNVAINELLELVEEQEAGSYPDICFTYDLLSGFYFHVANFDKAVYYSLESIKNVRTAFDSAHLVNFYLRAGNAYGATGGGVDKLAWDRKALDRMITTGQTSDLFNMAYFVALDLLSLKRPREALELIVNTRKNFVPVSLGEKSYLLTSMARCYAALHNTAMAEKYAQEVIEVEDIRTRRKEHVNAYNKNWRIALMYYDMGQYDNAEKFYKKIENEVAKRTKVNFLFKMDSARGNYFSAIKHLQASQMLSDSTFTATKTRQIEELKVVYETEQKDKNIQLLTQQNSLQQATLQRANLMKNVTIAGIALAFVIIGLLYRLYRQKQKSNKVITQKNGQLQHFLKEKEWLLKEIHHRVKNNLQIVMSLLNSQSVYIDNEPALTAIHNSQHRVQAISLIHQKLYNTENVSSIDISFYIRELVSYLSDCFDTGQRIRFEVNVEKHELDVGQAVPVGLILNEVITNSIKYAFPAGRAGVISISFSTTAPDQFTLKISDNGIGMPRDFDAKRPGSLGMSLIRGLSDDLEGNFSIESNNGTTLTISFTREVGIKQPDNLSESLVSVV